ncbi:hypothetical protein [Opitutus sp. GAS368]|uniref:hypothetical protein n=1 Tax=Opitutus sp. GAS368 TaxID=1882749 RepID=UPI000879FECA|nr:hypothetical protein [Opitutus sp. GAS368]SDR97928.1 hypothetical protein SAMN05444173_1517 [Opitutus sp. GAS368]
MKSFFTRRLVLSLATLVVAGGLTAAWMIGRVALRPVALYSGWLLLALVLALTFFNARKKLPFFPLISASHWLQAHIYLGWLACVVFVLHTGGRWPDGAVEVPLALAFVFVAGSGVLGLWLSRWLPPRLTRSGESLVYERIPMLRHRLVTEVKQVVRGAETETQSTTLGDFYVRVLAGYFAHVPAWLAPLAGGDAEHHRVKLELEALRQFLSVREIALADQLADLIEAKRNLDNQFAGQRLLKLWLFVHIPLTFVLLVFTAGHVWLVLHYSHR